MLSIVICHRKPDLLAAIKKSIEATVGVSYELVVIDNTQNEYNIFSAYNEGVKRAKFDIVCFTHEDILFYTNNWGEKVIKHFDDAGIGMIGVVGGMAQSAVPSAWWYNNYFEKSAINLLMRHAKKGDGRLYKNYFNPFNDKQKTEVVVVDGLWFCIRKKLFDNICFDEKTYTGFHLYDADISMQVLKYAKIFVVYDILIEHVWTGTISKDYYTGLIEFSKKWQSHLPVKVDLLPPDYFKLYDWHVLRSIVLAMGKQGFSKREIKELIASTYPGIKKRCNSTWFKNYFFFGSIAGYGIVNFFYYRLEKLTGFSKDPGHAIISYDEKVEDRHANLNAL